MSWAQLGIKAGLACSFGWYTRAFVSQRRMIEDIRPMKNGGDLMVRGTGAASAIELPIQELGTYGMKVIAVCVL